MLPPGRAKPETNPEPRGSLTTVNTIGIALVSRRNVAVTGVEEDKMTSGRRATSSAAKALVRLLSALVQRCSIRAVRPSFQPNRVNFVNECFEE